MRFSLSKILFLLAAITLIAGPVRAADEKAEPGLTPVQKTEVQQVIKEYLRDHPEMIIESLQAYQEKQQKDSLISAQQKIEQNKTVLTAAGLPGAGNPKGDVTVVEFFDYNCGYCKKAVHDVMNIVDTDKNVRFVFFDMPILGPSSITAAQWAYAAQKQGKFYAFHTAMLQHNGPIDDSVLEDAAKKAGMDVAQAKKDADSADATNAVTKSRELGQNIGIQGTPGFIINGTLFPGYLGEDGLKKAIDDARTKKS